LKEPTTNGDREGVRKARPGSASDDPEPEAGVLSTVSGDAIEAVGVPGLILARCCCWGMAIPG
jgi:hypothetical protein